MTIYSNLKSLGTPASGTVTNLTGTASININGTVGATTPSTGSFTTVTGSSDASINGLTVGRGLGNGSTNTAVGSGTLVSNTTGSGNTANGYAALYFNTTGTNNTANGAFALRNNNITLTAGSFVVGTSYVIKTVGTTNFTLIGAANNNVGTIFIATGVGSGTGTATANGGNGNTANGASALYINTTGNSNTANGASALHTNTTGNYNTANGVNALYANTTGSFNTANGVSALTSNITGSYNTANGVYALNSNTTGSGNTALNPMNSGGSYAPVFDPTTENNRFCMGSTGVTNAYIQVAWTVVSDARDKTDFAPVPHGLDFVSKLKPTAYRYKMNRSDTEGHGVLRYGFKAQEVLALEGDTPVIVDAEDADKLRFNDQSLMAVLVNAIQELKAEIDLLKGAK